MNIEKMKQKRPKKAPKPRKKRCGVDSTLKCPYCGSPVVYRSADGIYRENSKREMLYVCSRYPECDAYIKAHRYTMQPTGSLANGKTRRMRMDAHESFNKIWERGIMSRTDAYRWLGLILGMPSDEAHIAKMRDYELNRVIEESERMVKAWEERHPWKQLGEEDKYETVSGTAEEGGR